MEFSWKQTKVMFTFSVSLLLPGINATLLSMLPPPIVEQKKTNSRNVYYVALCSRVCTKKQGPTHKNIAL